MLCSIHCIPMHEIRNWLKDCEEDILYSNVWEIRFRIPGLWDKGLSLQYKFRDQAHTWIHTRFNRLTLLGDSHSISCHFCPVVLYLHEPLWNFSHLCFHFHWWCHYAYIIFMNQLIRFHRYNFPVRPKRHYSSGYPLLKWCSKRNGLCPAAQLT